jgi:2-oxoacid:acceptor oxidoreductase gamma subunit (pyruvate/2-ketoisovalerate family)
MVGGMIEIRVHGRGGQGVVLASEILVNALIKEGKFSACFPFFGFERRGAPVAGFIRFDGKPIRQKDQIYYPDCVVVMDGTLFKAVNVFQGIKEAGILVLNETKAPSELTIPRGIQKVGVVDATRISMETIQAFIPNTAMLGAVCRTTGWVGLDSLRKAAAEALGPKILKKNLQMMERAYQETNVFESAGEGQWR